MVAIASASLALLICRSRRRPSETGLAETAYRERRIYSNAPEGDIASVLPEFWETLDTEG
jgi:hypothetical protein